jgi:hypothetical protein
MQSGARCVSTQKVHPANPSTIQSRDSRKLGTCACVQQRKHWSVGQVREQQQAKRGLCPNHCSSAPNKGASSCFPLCPTTTGHCLQPSILSAASHTHTQSGHRPKSVMTVTTGSTTGHAMWHGPLCADKIQNAQQDMQARRRCKKEHTN